MAEQENQSLSEELRQCKENLKLLQEKGNNVSLYKIMSGSWVMTLALLLLEGMYKCQIEKDGGEKKGCEPYMKNSILELSVEICRSLCCYN